MPISFKFKPFVESVVIQGIYSSSTAPTVSNDYLWRNTGVTPNVIQIANSGLTAWQNLFAASLGQGLTTDGSGNIELGGTITSGVSIDVQSGMTFNLNTVSGQIALSDGTISVSSGSNATPANNPNVLIEMLYSSSYSLSHTLFKSNGYYSISGQTGANVMQYSGSATTTGEFIFGPASASNNNGVLQVTGGGLTGSGNRSLLTIEETWNTTGNPIAALINVTKTAAGSGSKLLDVQLSSTSALTVFASGSVQVNAGSTDQGYNLYVGGTTNITGTTGTGALTVTGSLTVTALSSTLGGPSNAINSMVYQNNQIVQIGPVSSSLQSGSTYSFALTDAMSTVFVNNGTAMTLTINSGIFPKGSTICIVNYNGAAFTLAAGSGVALHSNLGLISATPYAVTFIKYLVFDTGSSTEEWVAWGDLT